MKKRCLVKKAMKNAVTMFKKEKCKEITVAFIIGSGYGDHLIFANYLWHLKKTFSEIRFIFDVYFSAGFGLARTIFEEGDFVRHLFKAPESFKSEEYDCVFWFCRYPKVEYCNRKKVKSTFPDFYGYIKDCERFYSENHLLFDNSPYLDGYSALICISNSTTRLQQPDFDGRLRIGKDFKYPIPLSKNSFEFFKNNHIGKKFITIHRGNDTTFEGDAVKLWPLKFYNELVILLKQKYPEYLIVHLGVSRDRCPVINGVDVDVVGKTTMEDVKLLLKFSSLHIDSEGGFVHLRENLSGGQSVVLFGPTDPRFYAYEGNINIKGDGCDIPCEWIKKDWMIHCCKGYSVPPCMTSITPEAVMRRIVSEWKSK